MRTIIFKYLEGSATDSEKAELLQWLRKKENRIVFHSYKLEWRKGLKNEQFIVGGEECWNRLQEKLGQKSYNRWQESRKTQQFFRYAAIFFFALSIGTAVWHLSGQSSRNIQETTTSVIAENGQISKIELPDGSLVWLNSGSRISYNNFFAEQNREVELSGEAYFDVAKNAELPLVVNCNDLHVRVLGTKFNVAAYSWEEAIEVVLEEGTVELVNPAAQTTFSGMKTGQRAQFSKENSVLEVNDVNTSRFTAWKEGMINIYDQPLKDVVKRLEIRYNQKFVYDQEIENFRYTFTIKNERLEEIIRVMEQITPVKAIQQKDVIELKVDEEKKRKVD
jgi:ferric-dicitrate binding protein FerR (iron transport regulator)